MLACAPDEADGQDEASWVRATMGLVSYVFDVLISGTMGLEEIIAEVHEEQGIDGVLRTFGQNE